MSLVNNPYNCVDAQEATVLAECDVCGAELYEGDDVYEYDGETACSEPCLITLTGAEKRTLGEE